MTSQLNMPDELSTYIHDFIRPNIYRERMSSVMRQIDYHKNEFDYNRKISTNRFSLWFRSPESDYYKYALREAYLKKNVDKPYTTFDYYNNQTQALFTIIG